MIDQIARARLREAQQQKALINGIKSAVSSNSPSKDDIEMEALSNAPFKEVLRLASRKDGEKELLSLTNKIGQAIAKVYQKIPANIVLPKIFQVQGDVTATVVSTPDLKITNLSDLQPYFSALEKRLGQMATAISMIATTPPPMQKDIKFPEFDTKPLIEAINNIPKGKDSGSSDLIDKLVDIEEGIAALYNKPQMTPNPVTHVSLNALNGTLKTSNIQLGSTVTAMPAVALVNRRALQMYNNGSNTIYFGGSNVSSSNGIPVSSGAFSDILAFGQNISVYAISGAGQNNDIRVLEVSDEASGR
jgi:hypothetical protein